MGLWTMEKESSLWKVGAVAVGMVSAVVMWRASRRAVEPSDGRSSSNGSKKLATTQFNAEREGRNRRAMRVLMGWSVLNMAAGTRGYLKSEGSRRCFHEMNAGWGVVSAVGSSIGFLRMRRETGEDPAKEGVRRANALEKVLLADAGLSVASLAGGAYLAEKGRREGSKRLRGYGPALMVQGVFFLVFDAGLFTFTNRHRREFEVKISPMGGMLEGESGRMV